MSEHTKMPPTRDRKKIRIIFSIPGQADIAFTFPGTPEMKRKMDQLKKLLQDQTDECSWEHLITPWEEATPWEDLAKERIQQYSKAGIALRGARYREGISQKELAKRCGISQENLSKMENGKRPIGKQTAAKLAKALNISAKLLSF